MPPSKSLVAIEALVMINWFHSVMLQIYIYIGLYILSMSSPCVHKLFVCNVPTLDPFHTYPGWSHVVLSHTHLPTDRIRVLSS